MPSIVYQAALAGLTHRLRVIGADIDYTPAATGVPVRIRGIIGAATFKRELQSGPYENEATASLRIARTAIVTPKIGDTLTLAAGSSYRVLSIGDVPHSPEWNLGLEHDYGSEE